MRGPALLAALALGAYAPAMAQTPPPGNREVYQPVPPVVTPGRTDAAPPSDAIVLFDGKDLSQWVQTGRGGVHEPQWKVENGYMEIVPRTGRLQTKEKFGDCQLHVEWTEPTDIEGTSQGRGNSGVLLMGRYEVQVLDAWHNPTYADGMAAALYGQWPPLVNATRKPGEWEIYDIIFETPRFEGNKLVKPAYFTVFWNGVLVHNHQASMGPMVWRQVAHYVPQPEEEPLVLQNHDGHVRFRNIWIRPLGHYDEPEK